MKLDEIIDTNIMAFRAKEQIPGKVNMNKTLGSGWFSRVSILQDPHLVAKISHGSAVLSADGYFQYMQYVVDNKLADGNPYFPRIYDIILVDSHEDMARVNYTIKMEKLLPYYNVTAQEMAVLVKQIIDVKAYEIWRTIDDDYLNSSSAESLYNLIIDATKDYALDVGVVKLVDRRLMSALDAIKDVRYNETHMFGWDINKNNMMFRRIRTGVQLVITDPIA